MNSADKRIEELLNRAGQTISDLPKSDGKHLTYNLGQRQEAEHAVFAFARQSVFAGIFYCLAVHQDYILHLTDIIDRLETALENVCGERDYLKQIVSRKFPCNICVNSDRKYNDKPCNTCLYERDVPFFEYEGVPEDWSVDDENR